MEVIGHFRTTFSLFLKMSLHAYPFIWKWDFIHVWINSFSVMNGAPGLTLIERLKELRNGLLSNCTSLFPPSLQLTIFPISLQHLPFSNFFPQNTKMCFASERCGPFYCTSNSHMRFECNQDIDPFWSFKENKLFAVMPKYLCHCISKWEQRKNVLVLILLVLTLFTAVLLSFMLHAYTYFDSDNHSWLNHMHATPDIGEYLSDISQFSKLRMFQKIFEGW